MQHVDQRQADRAEHGQRQHHRRGYPATGLCDGAHIDTQPLGAAWSPDGATVFFVSDRGGGPQIYRVPAAGGSAQRVTFSGSYNISPAISPDGRWMAYIGQMDGGAFRVQLMDLTNGNVKTLTDSHDDESPSFAPNSKVIIYASRAHDHLAGWPHQSQTACASSRSA